METEPSAGQEYFNSYEDLEVHELMLRDEPRQEAYRNAILGNKSLFKEKVVLDVGSGTGILSIFCAQAGAKRVFAVEASNLATLSRDVIKENELDSVIEVFQCRIEDFQLPEGVEKVDIIVSEWMGFYLLHEGMLDSVLFARDQFLAPEGHMFPESCSIIVAPCAMPGIFEAWDDVNGVKMQKFAEQLRRKKSEKPEVTVLKAEHLLHEGEVVCWLDLKDVTTGDLDELFYKDIIVTQKPGKFQGVCIWFECTFPSSSDRSTPVVLSTNPARAPTHWKQTVVVLPTESIVELEEREPVAFHLIIKRNEEDARRYNLQLELLDSEEMEHPLPCNCLLTKCILAKAHVEQMETS